jgi:hypothetical protein
MMKKPLQIMIILGSLAMSCSGGMGSSEDVVPEGGRQPIPFGQLPSSTKEHAVSGPVFYVNVMGEKRPEQPTFPSLMVKPNWLRGYVKDVYGRSVAGAEIGVRSSIVGGSYSSASAVSDEKGYYEILLPVGTVEIWGAKYRLEYEGGRSPVSLAPADHRLDSFTSSKGDVKHFVLVPYGLANSDVVGRGPYWPSSYLGGSVHLSYTLRTSSIPLPGSFPVGTVIVVKLIPLDLVLADENISFIVRKVVESSELYINNLPLGRYRIELSLGNGTPISFRENINLKPEFGLNPKQAKGSAELNFVPGEPTVLAWYGNWGIVPLLLEHP